MALPPGSRLGPYEVVAPLGAGGMGEVYRARDARLGREVAVKVLPDALRTDPDRLRRFEQEARAASALNHPNLLAVFDVGTHDGVPYVVSELLEGETLRERLRAGGLTPARAVEHAVQIALGLAAAHEKGITHRDLKPENLFLTRDGRTKILDFGLAKLREPRPDGDTGPEVETLSHGTEPGAVLGTVGYMSPEQVRGMPADHRSDIFSFGAVLYEMLSNRRAFLGESSPEVLTAILKEDPPELSSSERNLPPALGRIVRRCLEKRPEDRFHSAHDLALALEATGGPSGPLAAAPPPGRRWPLRAALGVGLLTSVALGLYAGRLAWNRPPPSFHRLTFRRGIVTSARLTPDGGTVIYSAAWEGGGPLQIYSKPIAGREAKLLDLPPADVLAVSAQGEIALKRRDAATRLLDDARGTLAQVSLAGSVPRDVLENVTAADWSPDGRELAVARVEEGRTRLEFPVGKRLWETDDRIDGLRISPGGDRIALAVYERDGGGRVDVVDRGGHHQTLSGGWTWMTQVAWAPAGREVWFTPLDAGWMASLRAVTLSGKEREILPLPAWLRLQDVSRDGRVLLAITSIRAEMYGLAPGASRERNLSWYESSSPLSLSRDGTRLLFSEVAAGVDDVPLYLRGTDGSPAVRIGEGFPADLSPDGRWVATCPSGRPRERLKIIPTGPGEERIVGLGDVACRAMNWLPDGRRLLVQGEQAGRQRRTYVVDVAGGPPRPLAPEGTTCDAPSPDGREAACQDSKGNVLIYPLAGGNPRAARGLEPGETQGLWSADGRSLVVARWEKTPLRIFLVDLATGARRPWREFQPADQTGVLDEVSVVLTSDLRAYVYRYRRVLSDLYLVDGLR
ncbi:MAG TPA: protein kinase [Vicinamibacteria bacterium]|nr:protein kinase [Vicinamibacteria bacterium]